MLSKFCTVFASRQSMPVWFLTEAVRATSVGFLWFFFRITLNYVPSRYRTRPNRVETQFLISFHHRDAQEFSVGSLSSCVS